jgi:hypothetical protein
MKRSRTRLQTRLVCGEPSAWLFSQPADRDRSRIGVGGGQPIDLGTEDFGGRLGEARRRFCGATGASKRCLFGVKGRNRYRDRVPQERAR